MPYFFHWTDPTNHWDKSLEAKQCQYQKENKELCKRSVIIGNPYCWQHRKQVEHVEIKTSHIPHAGKGLFATNGTTSKAIVFRRQDPIIPYAGKFIDTAELRHRYHQYTAPYGVFVKKDVYQDGADLRGIGTLINHQGNKKNTNTEFYVSHNPSQVKIRATKNIPNGDELILSYGKDYKFNQPTQYTTNRNKHWQLD